MKLPVRCCESFPSQLLGNISHFMSLLKMFSLSEAFRAHAEKREELKMKLNSGQCKSPCPWGMSFMQETFIKCCVCARPVHRTGVIRKETQCVSQDRTKSAGAVTSKHWEKG